MDRVNLEDWESKIGICIFGNDGGLLWVGLDLRLELRLEEVWVFLWDEVNAVFGF